MNPLVELKERLVYSTVAGTQLLQEDFRLKRTMEMFAQLAQKNPVFAKIYTGLQQLLQGEKDQQGILLMNLLGLVDAVLYTQAGCGIEGEFTPIDNKENLGTVVQVRYSEIQPLLQALTTTGSGRMEVLTNTILYSPHVLADYRVIHALIEDLDDVYGEMASLIQQVVKCLGTGEQIALHDPDDYFIMKHYALPHVDKSQLISLLKKDFDPQGRKLMANKLSLIGSIAKEEENPWYLSLLETAKKDVREQLIFCLGYSEENIPLLLELVNKERGKNKEAINNVLGKHTFPGMVDFWKEQIKKNPNAVCHLQYGQSDEISDMLAEHLKAQCFQLIHGREPAKESDLTNLTNGMYATVGKISPGMLDFYHWILDNIGSLTNKKYEKVFGKGGMAYVLRHVISETLVYSCPQEMVDFLDNLPQKDVNILAQSCFISDLLTKSASYVYDKWHKKETLTPKVVDTWLGDCVFYHYGIYYAKIYSRMSFGNVYGYYSNITRKLKEPLDLRWFDWMMERNASGLLSNLTPNGPLELLQTVGEYFHKRALTTPWKQKVSYHSVSETLECLHMMNRCGCTDFRGTVLAMCKQSPSISWWNLRPVLQRYYEFAGAESTFAEAQDILQFYNESYQGGKTVEELRNHLVDEGFLKV